MTRVPPRRAAKTTDDAQPDLRYVEPLRRWRFLLSDGRIIDVESARDDSILRGWVLEQLGVKKNSDIRIEGVAQVPEVTPQP